MNEASGSSFLKTNTPQYSSHYGRINLKNTALLVSGLVLGSSFIGAGITGFFIYSPIQFAFPSLLYVTYISGISGGTLIVVATAGGTLYLIMPRSNQNNSTITQTPPNNNTEEQRPPLVNETKSQLPSTLDSKYLLEILKAHSGDNLSSSVGFTTISNLNPLECQGLRPIFDEFEIFLKDLKNYCYLDIYEGNYLNLKQEKAYIYIFEVIGSERSVHDGQEFVYESEIGKCQPLKSKVPCEVLKILLMGFAFKHYPEVLLGYGASRGVAYPSGQSAFLFLSRLQEVEFNEENITSSSRSTETIEMNGAGGKKLTLNRTGLHSAD